MLGELSDVGQCCQEWGQQWWPTSAGRGAVGREDRHPQPSPSFGEGEEHLFGSPCPLPLVQGAAGRGIISWRCFLFGEGVRAAPPPAGLGEAGCCQVRAARARHQLRHRGGKAAGLRTPFPAGEGLRGSAAARPPPPTLAAFGAGASSSFSAFGPAGVRAESGQLQAGAWPGAAGRALLGRLAAIGRGIEGLSRPRGAATLPWGTRPGPGHGPSGPPARLRPPPARRPLQAAEEPVALREGGGGSPPAPCPGPARPPAA